MSTHHFVLTVQKPQPVGPPLIGTWSGTCSPPEGATRESVYRDLLEEHDRARPFLANGNVLFFALERNAL